jgi:hypothetical protein
VSTESTLFLIGCGWRLLARLPPAQHLTAGKDPRVSTPAHVPTMNFATFLDWPNTTPCLITEQKKIWKSADVFVRHRSPPEDPRLLTTPSPHATCPKNKTRLGAI